MMHFAYLCTILGLAATAREASNITSVLTHRASTRNTTVYVTNVMSNIIVPIATTRNTENASAHISPKRHVLITNSKVLRTRDRPLYRKKDVTSLKYIEYDDSGAMLNTVFMYNLKDVARFFEMYLDTVVCQETCDN